MTIKMKLNDGAKNVFSAMLGIKAEYVDDVKDVLERSQKVTVAMSDKVKTGLVKAFADAGMGVTPADTFTSQNESSNLPEPLPVQDEYRGLAMAGGQNADEGLKAEMKEEESKETTAGEQQTSEQEKTEVEGIIASIKDIIEADDVDKTIKKQGEEVIAELEAHAKSFENAQAFIKENAKAHEAGETEEEEKKEEGSPAEKAEEKFGVEEKKPEEKKEIEKETEEVGIGRMA